MRSGAFTAAALLAVTAVAGCDGWGNEAQGTAPPPAASPEGPTGPTGTMGDGKAKEPAPRLPVALTGQRLGWSTCQAPSAAQGGGDAPGRGWECATMTAPLDYKRPDGDTIGVAMIRKKATGPQRERIGSLVFNFGGPGDSGIVALPESAEDYARLNTRYDLVSFDPRGVGDTATVNCGDDSEEDTAKYAAACQKHSGKVLPHVGTSNTARDMDLMRRLLGEDRLHYFGFSYGTELGGVYAHLFPGKVGRAVLDAPVDPTEDQARATLSQAKSLQLAFDRFADYCAGTHEDCPTGSDPEQAGKRVGELLDRLGEKPAPTDDSEDLDADLAALGIANALDYAEEGWDFLVDALAEVMDRGTGNHLLDSAYYGVGESARGETSTGNFDAAYTAITCADSDQRLDFAEIEEMLPGFRKASPVFGESWSLDLYMCLGWPVDGERTTPDVSAEGAAPILVVGNTGDPTTPYPGAKHMTEELGRDVGILLTVDGEGHTTYGGYDCVDRTVDAYLLDGTVPRDGARCS